MRSTASLAILVFAACGNDHERLTDGGPIAGADGSTLTAGARELVPGDSHQDGTDATPALTDCKEAAQHSDLTWIEAHVLAPACATATCHTGDHPSAELVLDVGAARAQLVNRATSTLPGWIRVVPGAPSASYLVVALGRTPGPAPEDGFMPFGTSEPLCVEKLDAIERWISAGALP